jgi:hypothetical protein
MPTLELYPFRFRDPLTGGWVRARHKLQVPELQRHYLDWEITGAPEIRHVTPTRTEPFNPFEPPARADMAPMLLWTDDEPYTLQRLESSSGGNPWRQG